MLGLCVIKDNSYRSTVGLLHLSAYFLRASVKPCWTSRSKFSCYTFAFLALAVLVFTWGLQYKLSLYAGPDSTVHHMVKAKLLSNDKKNEAPDGVILSGPLDARASHEFVFPSVLTSLFVLNLFEALFGSLWQVQTLEPSSRTPFAAGLNAFFFRPPPIFC